MDSLTAIAPYFLAEKQESMLFVAVGVLAVVAAARLWLRRPAWRGAALPLVAVAAIQLTVGTTVWLRSDAQAATLTAQAAADPAGFVRDESERMGRVMRNFRIYRAIEVALLVAGIALAVVAARFAAPPRRRQLLRSFGLALALQAGFMLVLDFFAEDRAERYLAAVETRT